jgi:hypothetical protein
VSNHLKWLANELPVTFIYTGVGLAGRGLFAEGLTGQNAALAQTGRRWTSSTRRGFPPEQLRWLLSALAACPGRQLAVCRTGR